jgi:hypothetical protein
MTRRARWWILSLAALDALSFALTIHAHLTFHRTGGGPSVMSAGQLIGWLVSVTLLLLLLVVVHEVRSSRRR